MVTLESYQPRNSMTHFRLRHYDLGNRPVLALTKSNLASKGKIIYI